MTTRTGRRPRLGPVALGALGRWSMLVLLMAVTATATLPHSASAQRGPEGRRGSQDRAELERRFRAHMARMVQERLELDDAEAETLGEVMKSFEDRRRELGRAEFRARRQLEMLAEQSSTTDEEAGALLDHLVELRARESALFAEEQEALLEVLTATQVLELHELRSELGRRIRALRSRGEGNVRRRRRGGDNGNVDGLGGVGLSL